MAHSRRNVIVLAALVALAAGSTMARADDCSSLNQQLAQKQSDVKGFLLSWGPLPAHPAKDDLALLRGKWMNALDEADAATHDYRVAKVLLDNYQKALGDQKLYDSEVSERTRVLQPYYGDINTIKQTIALLGCDTQTPAPSPSQPNKVQVDNTAITVAGLGEVGAGGAAGLDLGSSGGTPTPPPPPMPSVIGLPDGQTLDGATPLPDLLPSTGSLREAAGGLNAARAAVDNAISDPPPTQPSPPDTPQIASPQPPLPARTASLSPSGPDLPAPGLFGQAANAINAQTAAVDDAMALGSGANSAAAPLLPPRAPTATANATATAAPSSGAGSGPMGYCRYAGASFTLNVQWPAASPCPSDWCQGWGGTSTSNSSPGITAGHCTDPSQTMVPLTCSGQVWGGPCGSSSVTASSAPTNVVCGYQINPTPTALGQSQVFPVAGTVCPSSWCLNSDRSSQYAGGNGAVAVPGPCNPNQTKASLFYCATAAYVTVACPSSGGTVSAATVPLLPPRTPTVTASSTPNIVLPSRSFPAATPAPAARANLCSTVSPQPSSAPVSARQAVHSVSTARSVSSGTTRQATRNLCSTSHSSTRSANSFRSASAGTHSGGFGGGTRGFGGFGGGMRGHR